MSASNMFNKTLQTSHRGVSLDKCTHISNMSTSPDYHGYSKTKICITGVLNAKSLVMEIRDECGISC